MWFNNAIIYQFKIDEACDLNASLAEERLNPCPPHARFIYGWLPAFTEDMVHEVAGASLICMGKEERILPKSVIKKILAEKVQQIETQHGRHVKRAEKAQMAEELEFELLPKSFCVQKKLNALLDTSSQHLIINSSSANQASQLLSLLRKSVRGLTIEPLALPENLSFIFAEWIRSPHTLPSGFQLGTDCVLSALDNEKKRIHCKGCEIPSEEILTLLSQGMTPIEMSLIWKERIQFTLTHDFLLKKLKSLDYLIDDFNEIKKMDEEYQQLDAALALLSGELRQLYQELLATLTTPKKHLSQASKEEWVI